MTTEVPRVPVGLVDGGAVPEELDREQDRGGGQAPPAPGRVQPVGQVHLFVGGVRPVQLDVDCPGEDVTGDGADAEGLYQRGARELRMALVSLMGAPEALRRWPEMSSAYSGVSTPTRAMRPSASAWMPHP